jgi:hypothetical protein
MRFHAVLGNNKCLQIAYNNFEALPIIDSKSLIMNNLPRMDSNHDKVIQSHFVSCLGSSREFRGGKLCKQKLSKNSFDSFRVKFGLNR